MVDPQEKEVSLVLLFLAALAFLRAVLVAFPLAAATALLPVPVLVLLFIAAIVLFVIFSLFTASSDGAGSIMIWHFNSLLVY